MISTRQINNVISKYNLEIIRGKGYQYFLDTITGNQIGESVYVCYLNQLTIKQWESLAKYARENE